MFSIRIFLGGVCAAIFMVIASAGVAGSKEVSRPEAIQGVKGKCATTKTAYRTSEDTQGTNSGSFVPVDGAKININPKGGKKSCVIVRFSGQAQAETDREIYVEPHVGGDTCSPGQVKLQSATDGLYQESNAHQWVCRGVEGGKQPVEIFWRRGNTAANVFLYNYTMIVEYD